MNGHVCYLENGLHQVYPVGSGQHQIEQHKAGPLLLHQAERLIRVSGDHQRVTRLGEGVPHVPQRLRVVVHARTRVRSVAKGCKPAWRRAGPVALPTPSSCATGRVKVNRLPSSGPSLSARIRPPWASTIPLQMASPRPVPPRPRPLSSPSSRENSEQARQSLGGYVPAPSSATENAT